MGSVGGRYLLSNLVLPSRLKFGITQWLNKTRYLITSVDNRRTLRLRKIKIRGRPRPD